MAAGSSARSSFPGSASCNTHNYGVLTTTGRNDRQATAQMHTGDVHGGQIRAYIDVDRAGPDIRFEEPATPSGPRGHCPDGWRMAATFAGERRSGASWLAAADMGADRPALDIEGVDLRAGGLIVALEDRL